MTVKCPASRTASDDHPSGIHTSDAHLSDKHLSNEHSSDNCPNDEHTSDRHSNDDHLNDERPSDVQSTDNPTHEQIKGRPDEQQWHDATSTETYGIHKKNIATCNVGFNVNKTRHDHKHANANAKKPELITTDETTKCTISRATDDTHQTSDSTYEDAAEVPLHITTCDAILDMNKTYHEPDNINTTFEGQEFVISNTIAKCPASHTASNDHSNSAHTSDACLSSAHASDMHPSDKHSTNDPAHKRTKGRTNGQLLHDAADAETRDVPKKGNIVADTVSHVNAQVHIPSYKNFKADNELWDDQATLASAEDEHLDDSTSDQATAADTNQDDNYSKPTHYPQNRRHCPELKPSDLVSSRDNYMLTRCRSMLIPKQTKPHKIAEQVTDDIYCLAELNRATSMGQCLEIVSKWFFMEYPKEPISKDPSFGLAPPWMS
ncbi:hypothetical protein EV182_002620 [Spiromyces aspiralis]|uniref:Uncharacterized protein n=1 Tax=Spiromyces aspiralis TaxID=68401 RepID=A0ACC1HRI7_9FUNG|nr:hypothetical protein EV182_002620 [Spiromyces aspiralis]